MILLCGIPSEGPVAAMAAACVHAAVPYRVVSQRAFAEHPLTVQPAPGGPVGTVGIDGEPVPLAQVTGLYLRVMDPGMLPEIRGLPTTHPTRLLAERWHQVLLAWAELTPARVANRASAMASNASKPYQAQLVRGYGFDVPETLVTNDPALVLELRDRHGRIVYKSASAVRSVVRELGDDDLRRLDRVRWCPTQFQELVEGDDVRVHTVGDAVFATAIRSSATDYRYAGRDGVETSLEAVTLPDDLARRCVELASGLDLPFAGIDLRLAPDGRVVCFEVNPSPAFTYYESHTGQPIAAALVRWLSGPG